LGRLPLDIITTFGVDANRLAAHSNFHGSLRVMRAVSDLFLSLTPEAVLDAVEAAGLRCASACNPLNSYENRVYEVGLEDGDRIIAKFYRPHRWTREQILEEHAFIDDCHEDEIPVTTLRRFPNGSSLEICPGTEDAGGIFYALFERRGGRAPEELSDEMLERLGMLTARLHNAGAKRPARHRHGLTPDRFIRESVAVLKDKRLLPEGWRDAYVEAALAIADVADRRLAGVPLQRIHGDLHLGNLVERGGILNVLDFDDSCMGPVVQDMWLVLPGRDGEARRQREVFLEGYEQLRRFDRSTLRLIEPLRAMRIVHYSAWLARRWHDPAFPATWPHFGTEEYWMNETRVLMEIRSLLDEEDGMIMPDDSRGQELTNKDFFWDWEEK
jgi:Ser/Thr protein kinase RdoA (MazF antagonist)